MFFFVFFSVLAQAAATIPQIAGTQRRVAFGLWLLGLWAVAWHRIGRGMGLARWDTNAGLRLALFQNVRIVLIAYCSY